MHKLIFIGLLGASACALAQTPAARIMPDGSKDMYAGLGITSAPRYKGAEDRETNPALLVQMQWSNGVFLSGSSLGMHLSQHPAIEYGPLLAIEPGRHASGTQKRNGVDGIDGIGAAGITNTPVPQTTRFTDISSRPVAGGFLNHYLDETLRLTSSLLYGAGDDRNGLLLNAGVQKSFLQVAPHHRLALSAGFTWANRRYTQAYFGVDPARTGGALSYAPSAGVRDVHLTLHWNWELSHQWLLASQLTATRLMGDAANSPLTDRRNGIAARTGLAYRF